MLFMGEEWGASTPWQYFTDHTDPAIAEAVRQGRRREFAGHGWELADVPDPQAPETFERSRLDWDEPAASPTPGCSPGTATSSACARARPTCATRASTSCACSTTPLPARWSCAAAAAPSS